MCQRTSYIKIFTIKQLSLTSGENSKYKVKLNSGPKSRRGLRGEFQTNINSMDYTFKRKIYIHNEKAEKYFE